MAGPAELSNVEIDRYSLNKAITDDLVGLGFLVHVEIAQDNWPVGAVIQVPGVYILTDTNENTGFELGAYGIRREVFIHIYGKNDADRYRMAEAMVRLFRKNIPIYDYVTGNEADPLPVGFLDTEDVDYRPIRPLTTTPDAERWRIVVHATLLREDS